jgi:sugar lactone lactonase YvrE
MPVAIPGAGDLLIADSSAIREITPSGVVSTLASSGVSGASGLAVDSAGDLFIADTFNNQIRKITPDRTVTTLAGSGATGSADDVGTAASFNAPTGVALDSAGNVYVADSRNDKIRKITPAGVVSTFAGSGTFGAADGAGSAASFNNPQGIATDAADNVYVADTNNHVLRKITPAGVVSTLAITDATGCFVNLRSVTIDRAGLFYVTNATGATVCTARAAGSTTLLAGVASLSGEVDSKGNAARFSTPHGVVADGDGNLYIAEQSGRIRKITPAGDVTTIAGGGLFGRDGTGTAAGSANPWA